jgi:asparagine synthase (glutamine-hydrolysing)
VIEFAMSLPMDFKINGSNGKFILKELLSKYLPKDVFDRPKQGFALPIESWLKGPLEDWVENLLDPRKMSEDGYFDSDVVYQKWREHRAGKHNWQTELWDVLMFQAWLDNEKQ